MKTKGNRVVLDLASGVSVTARRQSAVKLSNQAAYQTARSSLLASQVRALEKAIASRVVNSTVVGVDSGTSQFALEKQLTDARITASSVSLLRKQVNDIAQAMTSIERNWSTLKTSVIPNKLKSLANDYSAQVSKLKASRIKSPAQRDMINASMLKLNELYQLNKSNIMNSARQEKDRLSTQLTDYQSALLAKKMELEKALHADRQVRALQEELRRLRPLAVPRIKRKIKKTRRRRAV